MSVRSLLREVAFDYVRTYERYERLQTLGRDATEEFSHLQDMERDIHVRETSGSWRQSRVVGRTKAGDGQ